MGATIIEVNSKAGKIIVSIIFILVGAGVLYFGNNWQNNLMKNGIKTTGTVMSTSKSQKNNNTLLNIRFTAQDGRTYTVKQDSPPYINPLTLTLGKTTVPIIYEPQNPRNAQLDTVVNNTKNRLVIWVVGVLFILGGLVVLFGKLQKASPPQQIQ